ncbi:E3 ubiquitin-protein ligase rglg3 [Thalictrum thalictroides]|uniref:E3 ubiquitin-protein ligase rglg3 n=1 Tax=Thalictrum thalictroides TaxID=46969 RepID=A0A7J6UTV2_THATH|nr:E3 ubiquitin-protein ligase rglg3 [Thalictrum thalictroides]
MNVQFVDFTKIMSENKGMSEKETAFALAALMEIPLQYKATQRLSMLGSDAGVPRTRPLTPPREVIDRDNTVKAIPHMTSFSQIEDRTPVEQVCPICLTNPKDMAFGCGHLTCKECGITMSNCPLCREPITTRLRLYT